MKAQDFCSARLCGICNILRQGCGLLVLMAAADCHEVNVTLDRRSLKGDKPRGETVHSPAARQVPLLDLAPGQTVCPSFLRLPTSSVGTFYQQMHRGTGNGLRGAAHTHALIVLREHSRLTERMESTHLSRPCAGQR